MVGFNGAAMSVVVQHLTSKLYLTREGGWVELEAAPAVFKDPVSALTFCMQRGIRSVRLVGNATCPGGERFIYPFGGDPVVKAERKKRRRKFAENRRLQHQQRALMAGLDVMQAEARERKKQVPFNGKREAEKQSAAAPDS